MMHHRKSSKAPSARTEKGFTLIEISVAMAVLGVVFLAMAQLLAIAIQQNSMARYSTIGVEVARGQLEELNARYNNELATGVPASELVAGDHGPVQVSVTSPSGQNRVFNVRWNVARGLANSATVTMIVNPQIQNPLQTKQITISSRFAP